MLLYVSAQAHAAEIYTNVGVRVVGMLAVAEAYATPRSCVPMRFQLG
jgi:hypothetical protein